MRLNYCLGFLTLLLFSCSDSDNDDVVKMPNSGSSIFQKVPSSKSNLTFINTAVGDENTGMFNYDYFYNGGGVATGDLNNDGLVDIVFSGNSNPNQIYLNKGDLVFEDISESSGIQSDKWSTGLTLIDINSDGWLDIYVCNSGPFPTGVATANQLYINNKNNTFTESASAFKIDNMGRSTHASFFDMDNDGDLDLFILNHSIRNRGNTDIDWFNKTNALSDKIKQRESCAIYRNDGKNQFKNITESAGIAQVGFGLGHAIRDFNEDGLLDIYVSNDFFIPDFLYINRGNGTFKEEIKEYFGHTSFFAMGTDASDINNDGLFDLITVDMTPGDHFRNKTMMASMNVESFNFLKNKMQFIQQYMFNSLYVNAGNGQMKDIGLMCGVSQTDWSWSPLLCDFDNSGYKDIFITNGFSKDILNNDWKNELKQLQRDLGDAFDQNAYNDHLQKADATPLANQYFTNLGNLDFINNTNENGLSEPSFSNGAAYADFDNDGDLELVINNFEKEAFLYKNTSRETSGGNYLNVTLQDPMKKGGELHASVCINYNDSVQCNTYAFARGFQSYVQPMTHFGLGKVDKITSIEVKWQDGTHQLINSPSINTTLNIKKNGSKNKLSNTDSQPLFTDITSSSFSSPHIHIENIHNEYAKEILLPHSQSNEGPALAVADINNDGLEDFYVGGAAGQPSKVYVQSNDGSFKEVSNPQFEMERTFEDVGATFADIDMDGDLDIFVASGGGSEFVGNDIYLKDRLYANDGTGLFTKVKIPEVLSSTKAVLSADLNNDGLLEILTAGRTTPGKYPTPPKTHILSTTRQGIIDKTREMANGLSDIGMVTDVIAEDINSDGLLDVILVGEWMPITVLINTDKGLVNKTDQYQLGNTTGWWSHINAGDFDNDGDTDYIIGNIGSNNKFHPSKSKPLYLNANDFDDSGSIDIVLNKIYNGKRVPTRGKECSTEQMPFISKKFDSYEKFASASLDEIYTPEKLNDGINLSANIFESVLLENTGSTFEVKPLPPLAQMAPINGSVVLDVNKDGNLDIVVGGNKFNTEVETQRYDSGSGCILIGDGNGGFTSKWQSKDTGLNLNKDVRDIQLIHIGKQRIPGILVANNNGPLQIYQLK